VLGLAAAKEKAFIKDHNPKKTNSRHPISPAKKKMGTAPFLLTFLIMGFVWALFSGKFDPFHLGLGLGSCLIVAAFSGDLLFPAGIKPAFIIHWLRFAGYIPWLFYQILLANLHVLNLVFHPRMMALIDPKIIEFDSQLTSDISRTTFANSITLTPGTITVNVSVLGKYTVHCIDEISGRSLPGEMEARIAKIFGA
jgi:multicomponent Na+:H+ antiporter subunit E